MAVPLDVLFEDNHLLVVCKPACLPTVPDASGDESLLDRAKLWIKERYAKPGDVFLGVVQRLDRPVSGVIVFARTSKAAARLSLMLREHRIQKVYLALGEGLARGDAGELEQWLVKDERTNRVESFAHERAGAQRALTRWRVLARRNDRTLYEFAPLTGRPHQLRSAAVALGTPLVGDLKYGASAPLPDKSIALHARTLSFEHPVQGGLVQFEAPLPLLAIWDLARQS